MPLSSPSTLSSAPGTKRHPKTATNKMPTPAQTNPTGAKSNIWKGAPETVSRYCAIMMLGGVPIRVTNPPKIVANDSGIKVALMLLPAFFAACISTGIKSASAATLFMKADKIAPVEAIMEICAPTPRPVSITERVIMSIAPEFCRPRDTISTSATIIVAGWPKPAKACDVGTTPNTSAINKAQKATMS